MGRKTKSIEANRQIDVEFSTPREVIHNTAEIVENMAVAVEELVEDVEYGSQNIEEDLAFTEYLLEAMQEIAIVSKHEFAQSILDLGIYTVELEEERVKEFEDSAKSLHAKVDKVRLVAHDIAEKTNLSISNGVDNVSNNLVSLSEEISDYTKPILTVFSNIAMCGYSGESSDSEYEFPQEEFSSDEDSDSDFEMVSRASNRINN